MSLSTCYIGFQDGNLFQSIAVYENHFEKCSALSTEEMTIKVTIWRWTSLGNK